MEMKPLWLHQSEGIARASGLNYFALLFDPGVGKSRTTIEILRGKYATHGGILPTLIFCPPIVVKNWQNEWLTYSKVKLERIILLKGTGKERLKLFLESPIDSIFVTNYESLLMEDLFNAFIKRFNAFERPACLVLDESHRVKTPQAKRTKKMILLSKNFRYRYLLTGTPILRDLMDIFSQWLILDQGSAFGHNFFSFRARYFYDKNSGMSKQKHFPDWRVRPGVEKEVQAKMQTHSMYVEKSKCLDLPPLVRQVIEVQMSPEQARLYKSMKQDLIATMTTSDGKLKASIAELAITKALRLLQISAGFLRVVEDGSLEAKTISIKDNPRKAALRDLLEEITPANKCLVWAVFRANYADIRSVCEDLKIGFVELHGESKDRDAAIEKINNDPNTRVLIGHPGSAGLGINLVSASYSIFYSRGFSLEYDIQAEARNYRSGSEVHEKITRIDLVAPGTIDELVMKSLASKQAFSDKILKENLNSI